MISTLNRNCISFILLNPQYYKYPEKSRYSINDLNQWINKCMNDDVKLSYSKLLKMLLVFLTLIHSNSLTYYSELHSWGTRTFHTFCCWKYFFSFGFSFCQFPSSQQHFCKAFYWDMLIGVIGHFRLEKRSNDIIWWDGFFSMKIFLENIMIGFLSSHDLNYSFSFTKAYYSM